MITPKKVDFVPYCRYDDCMTNSELFAYTVGIIDGEGYIGLIPHSVTKNSFSPTIKVASTNIELVNFLKENFGGHLDKMRDHHSERRKKSATWTLKDKKNVAPFLLNLLPYLLIKDKQAKVILSYMENCSYKALRQKDITEEVERRISHYKQIRILNHRGLPLAETK